MSPTITKPINLKILQVEHLETVTQSICCLFSCQPLLAEHIPVLGHLPSVFQKMLCQNDAIHKSCILVIHILSSNEVREK